MRKSQNPTNIESEFNTEKETSTAVATAVDTVINKPTLAYTIEDVKNVETHCKKVLTELGKAEKAFTNVACQVRWLYENDRYKALETASSFEDFIKNRFNFKKSQGYALIRIVDRFGAVDEYGEYSIKKEYQPFGQSKLMLMVNLTDEQIKENITPDMTVSELRKVVKSLTASDSLGVVSVESNDPKEENIIESDSDTAIDVAVTAEKNVQQLIAYNSALDLINDMDKLLPVLNKVYKAKPHAKIIINYEWDSDTDTSLSDTIGNQ